MYPIILQLKVRVDQVKSPVYRFRRRIEMPYVPAKESFIRLDDETFDIAATYWDHEKQITIVNLWHKTFSAHDPILLYRENLMINGWSTD